MLRNGGVDEWRQRCSEQTLQSEKEGHFARWKKLNISSVTLFDQICRCSGSGEPRIVEDAQPDGNR